MVVATAEGLARLPERVRRHLVDRWGVVYGVRTGANEVMVHYPRLEGKTLELVPDDEELSAWRRSLFEHSVKQKHQPWRPRSR